MDVENMPKIVPMEEREWFVLFAICVAGKSAKQTQAKLNALLWDMGSHAPAQLNQSAFDMVWWADKQGELGNYLRKHKMGQYKRIERAFSEVVTLYVSKDLSVERLESIPGIGPKTARFIMLYCDENCNAVPLDTHILKFLAKAYPFEVVPKSTPAAGKRYNELERLFQAEAERQGKTVRQLDTEVWQYYAKQ